MAERDRWAFLDDGTEWGFMVRTRWACDGRGQGRLGRREALFGDEWVPLADLAAELGTPIIGVL